MTPRVNSPRVSVQRVQTCRLDQQSAEVILMPWLNAFSFFKGTQMFLCCKCLFRGKESMVSLNCWWISTVEFCSPLACPPACCFTAGFVDFVIKQDWRLISNAVLGIHHQGESPLGERGTFQIVELYKNKENIEILWHTVYQVMSEKESSLQMGRG